MHKEEVVVTPRKPRAAVRTSIVNAEDDAVTVNHTINIHSRLPSTDSGIQADGGFDSLSRYKGKTFISTCSDQVSSESPGASVSADISGGSSGYSSDHSLGSLPLSLKVRQAPSQSSTSSNKPVPPAKPNLTSSPSKRLSATPPVNSSQTLEIRNARTAPKVKPPSPPEVPATPLVKSSGVSIQHSISEKSNYVNHNITTTKPVVPKRTELGSSVTNKRPSVTIATKENSGAELVSMFPTVKVVASDNSVKLSISNCAISSSEHPSSTSPPMITSTTTTILNKDPAGSSVKPTDLNLTGSANSVESTGSANSVVSTGSANSVVSTGSANSVVSTGSAVKLQVINPTRKVPVLPEIPRNQGQGCVTLTRPLKLGAPSKVSVKTVQATVLNPQPAHLIPVQISSSQEDDKQHQQQQYQKSQHYHQMSPARMKPKIAPRPSVLSKTVSTQPTVITTNSIVSTNSTNFENGPPSLNLIRKNSTKTANSSQATPESLPRKPDSSVVHRIKPASQAVRTEIPVTHIVQRAPSYKTQLYSRPTSFNRYTPEREKHKPLYEQHTRQPIYENVRFDIREGFDFDDADTRMKHAELILKRSDELINDALRMLGPSPEGSRASPCPSDGVRIVEGAESSSPVEHRIPIFDARTGKVHSGTNISFFNGTDTKVASANGDVQPQVTWKERKERMNSALSWLKYELAGLRDMDSTLISQFKRCQETIDTLKTQRDVWEGLSEEGEEGEYWDDYELNEYNRRYLDSPGGSSSSQFSPGSREPSLQDVTLISLPVPQLSLPDDRKSLPVQHAVKQDIEATL